MENTVEKTVEQQERTIFQATESSQEDDYTEKEAPKEKTLFSALEKSFSGGLYLALCIVHSASVIFSDLDRVTGIIGILIAVGMWFTFIFARKSGKMEQKAGYIDFIRIPLLINQIMLMIASVAVVLGALLVVVTSFFTTAVVDKIYDLTEEMILRGVAEISSELVPYVEPTVCAVLGISGITAVVVLLVFAVLALVSLVVSCCFNSAALSVTKNFKDVLKGKAADVAVYSRLRRWLIVMCVINFLPLLFTKGILSSVTMIVAFIFTGEVLDIIQTKEQ